MPKAKIIIDIEYSHSSIHITPKEMDGYLEKAAKKAAKAADSLNLAIFGEITIKKYQVKKYGSKAKNKKS